jgi:hypothetical protein
MELLIAKELGLQDSKTSEYDLTDEQGTRYEVKFSRAFKKYNKPITMENLKEAVLLDTTPLASTTKEAFDCNIQQVKPKLFDYLIYGIVFTDTTFVYKVPSSEIENLPQYSNKQHRGNVGEGQFHMKHSNIDAHQKYLLFSKSML